MENFGKEDFCTVEPLEPLKQVVYHKQVTVKEAYGLLAPELQGLFFTLLVARAEAHRTAAALGETEREQDYLCRALDDLTTKTINHILSFPTAYAVKDARRAIRALGSLPDHVEEYLEKGRRLPCRRPRPTPDEGVDKTDPA